MLHVKMTPEGYATLEAKRNLHVETEIARQAVGEGVVGVEDLPAFMYALTLTCAFMVGEFQFTEVALPFFAGIGEGMSDSLSKLIYEYTQRFNPVPGLVFPKTWEEMKHELEINDTGFSAN